MSPWKINLLARQVNQQPLTTNSPSPELPALHCLPLNPTTPIHPIQSNPRCTTFTTTMTDPRLAGGGGADAAQVLAEAEGPAHRGQGHPGALALVLLFLHYRLTWIWEGSGNVSRTG
jgi:hypothetical protein